MWKIKKIGAVNEWEIVSPKKNTLRNQNFAVKKKLQHLAVQKTVKEIMVDFQQSAARGEINVRGKSQ